ncbi:MAG TPA: hypothetical protein VE442_14210 [Jatrophihabitans sp.]|jgi:hypothetical protein|nr:hypothetical protein [Jatrophihabitans sp.]
MSESQNQGQQGQSLENYSGDGSDLTEEQRQYLHTYAKHEVSGGGDQQTEVGAKSLSQNAEGEWA